MPSICLDCAGVERTASRRPRRHRSPPPHASALARAMVSGRGECVITFQRNKQRLPRIAMPPTMFALLPMHGWRCGRRGSRPARGHAAAMPAGGGRPVRACWLRTLTASLSAAAAPPLVHHPACRRLAHHTHQFLPVDTVAPPAARATAAGRMLQSIPQLASWPWPSRVCPNPRPGLLHRHLRARKGMSPSARQPPGNGCILPPTPAVIVAAGCCGGYWPVGDGSP